MKTFISFFILLLVIVGVGITEGVEAPTVKSITTQDLFVAQKNGRNLTLSDIGGSKSMTPTFDKGHKLILQYPILSESELGLGDIIIFENGAGVPVVHRIVEIGEDKGGWYCVTKGDNNLLKDPKVRFHQIKYLVVGVLY